MSFLSALAILLIALKLTGMITWCWWWVLCPLLLPVLIYLLVAIVVLTCRAIAVALAFIVDDGA